MFSSLTTSARTPTTAPRSLSRRPLIQVIHVKGATYTLPFPLTSSIGFRIDGVPQMHGPGCFVHQQWFSLSLRFCLPSVQQAGQRRCYQFAEHYSEHSELSSFITVKEMIGVRATVSSLFVIFLPMSDCLNTIHSV